MSMDTLANRSFQRLAATVTTDAAGGQVRTWVPQNTFMGFISFGAPRIVPSRAGVYSEVSPASIITAANPQARVGDVITTPEPDGTLLYLKCKAQRPITSPLNPAATGYIVECTRIEPPQGAIA